MASVLLIGLGKFGRTLGEQLIEMGDEVMIVDKDESKINPIASKYTNALIANCMNEESLASMDIPSFDICVVAIGDDFQSSLEITSILKDLGAKRIVSKATTDIQRKFLFRAGADEVIYPDRDVAEKLAVRINSKNIINFIDIDDTYAIFEISLPEPWTGKKLIDVNPRANYGINILTIKKESHVIASLNGDYMFEAKDQLVVFGNTQQILKFTNKFSVKKRRKK